VIRYRDGRNEIRIGEGAGFSGEFKGVGLKEEG
jgi:hypothetical protein